MTLRRFLPVLCPVLALSQLAPVSLTELNFCPTPSGRPARVTDPNFHPSHIPRGSDLVKVTLTSPEAVCNDGSPAIMYIRRSVAGARDPLGPVDNKWIIHLQEGGACLSHEVCLERWCGTGFYDASKMSSRFAPATMAGKGIFQRAAANHFGNYNHVYVYYCSSDIWTGRKLDSVLTDTTGSRPPFKLHFRGNRIIDAVFNELRAGLRDSQGQTLMPPLDQATHVYLTGSSAGSSGVRHNADRAGTLLRTRVPNAVFAVISDASLNGNSDEVSGLPPGNPNDGYTQFQTALYQNHIQVFDPQYDESCLQHNAALPWRCSDSVFLTQNHITSPIFNRTDLLDSNKVRDLDQTLYNTPAEFARASHDEITQFLRMRQTSVERASMTRDPGAYGPMCGVHITLDSDTFFARQVRVNNTTVSFFDALWNWVSGSGPVSALTTRPPLTPASPPFDPDCRSAGGPNPAPPAPLVAVSSASFDRAQPIAPDSIASVFGTDLAPELRSAPGLPLPNSLLGTQVGIRDRTGARAIARLIAVSPTQVNFIVPPGLAAGTATIGVQNGADTLFTGEVDLAAVSPGIYSANQRGNGVAAGLFLRVTANNARTTDLLFNPATLAPVQVDLGAADDQVFLLLFGTGFRNAAQGQLEIGGVSVPILSMGPQPEYPGLDQLNAGPLPSSLAGRADAEIVFTAGPRRANVTTVSFR